MLIAPFLASLSLALGAAQDRAQQYWGAAPCGGAFTVTFGALNDGASGEALGADTAQGMVDCQITLSSQYWTLQQVRAQWPAFCQTEVHEEGHLLLGFTSFQASNPADPSHSPDPTSPMFWQTTTQNIPAVCRWPHRRRRHSVYS